jgi:hypothetical protein
MDNENIKLLSIFIVILWIAAGLRKISNFDILNENQCRMIKQNYSEFQGKTKGDLLYAFEKIGVTLKPENTFLEKGKLNEKYICQFLDYDNGNIYCASWFISGNNIVDIYLFEKTEETARVDFIYWDNKSFFGKIAFYPNWIFKSESATVFFIALIILSIIAFGGGIPQKSSKLNKSIIR